MDHKIRYSEDFRLQKVYQITSSFFFVTTYCYWKISFNFFNEFVDPVHKTDLNDLFKN